MLISEKRKDMRLDFFREGLLVARYLLLVARYSLLEKRIMNTNNSQFC